MARCLARDSQRPSSPLVSHILPVLPFHSSFHPGQEIPHVLLHGPPESASSRKQEHGLCFAAPEPGSQFQRMLAGGQLCAVSSLAVCSGRAPPHPTTWTMLSVVTCTLVGCPRWALRPAAGWTHLLRMPHGNHEGISGDLSPSHTREHIATLPREMSPTKLPRLDVSWSKAPFWPWVHAVTIDSCLERM